VKGCTQRRIRILFLPRQLPERNKAPPDTETLNNRIQPSDDQDTPDDKLRVMTLKSVCRQAAASDFAPVRSRVFKKAAGIVAAARI